MSAAFIRLAFATLIVSLISSNAEKVTIKNYEEKTKGKAVFLWFYVEDSAPCEEMRTQILQLHQHYKDSPSIFIGEVDCTRNEEGKPEALCDRFGIMYHPYMKYGNPWRLKEYQEGRKYEDLYKFIDANVTVPCGPLNLDVCNDEEKILVQKYLDMDIDALNEVIENEDERLDSVEDTFKEQMGKINSDYNKYAAERDTMIEEIKDGDLGYLKAVAAGHMFRMKQEAKKEKEEAGASETDTIETE